MKTLNIKIPLSIAQSMDDKAQLNPKWVTYFITAYIQRPVRDEPIQEFTFNYSFKIDDNLHKSIKLKAIEYDLPMNELTGRLLATYY